MKSSVNGEHSAIPSDEIASTSYLRRNEDVVLGTLAELYFCMQYAGHYICRGDFHIKRRWEDSALIMLTLSGEGRLVYKKGQYALTRGSCMLIDIRNAHEYFSVGDGWEFKFLHFSGAMSEKYLSYLEEHAGPVFTLADDELARMEGIFDRILDKTEAKDIQDYPGLSCDIYTLLTMLLAHENRINRSIETPGVRAMTEAVAYIRDNYMRPIGTEDIARVAGLSRSYMSELFTHTYGMPPHEYLVMFRLSVAKNLLLNTQLTVTEIAEQTGFRDIFSFSRIFKRCTGISPVRYRQRHKSK